MSALGLHQPMSALPPKADMCSALGHVRFGPIADMEPSHSITSSTRARIEGGTVRPIALACRGVPIGNTNAAHEVTTKSLTPASPMVGTSGKVGQRCAEVTAKARIFPDWMDGT